MRRYAVHGPSLCGKHARSIRAADTSPLQHKGSILVDGDLSPDFRLHRRRRCHFGFRVRSQFTPDCLPWEDSSRDEPATIRRGSRRNGRAASQSQLTCTGKDQCPCWKGVNSWGAGLDRCRGGSRRFRARRARPFSELMDRVSVQPRRGARWWPMA